MNNVGGIVDIDDNAFSRKTELFVDFDKIRIKKKPKEIKIEIKEKEKEEKPKKKLIPSKKGKQLFK